MALSLEELFDLEDEDFLLQVDDFQSDNPRIIQSTMVSCRTPTLVLPPLLIHSLLRI